MSWGHSSLANTLRDQKKVIQVATCNFVVNNVSRIWVLVFVATFLELIGINNLYSKSVFQRTHHENSGIDPFLNHNKCEVWSVVRITLLTSIFKLRNLIFLHELQLAVSNTVSEDDNFIWQFIVHLLISHQGHVQCSAKTVNELLLLALDDRLTVPFRVGTI